MPLYETNYSTPFSCACGEEINGITVIAKGHIEKLSWVNESDLSEDGRVSIRNHENGHFIINENVAAELDGKLTALIGTCRKPKCMASTENYIDWLQEYYDHDANLRQLTYDIGRYPDGGTKRKFQTLAADERWLMEDTEKSLKVAETKMGEDCK